MVTNISEDSRKVFAQLQEFINASNICLASTEINGIECDCISAVVTRGEEVRIVPLAIIVNERLFEIMSPPDAGLGEDNDYCCCCGESGVGGTPGDYPDCAYPHAKYRCRDCELWTYVGHGECPDCHGERLNEKSVCPSCGKDWTDEIARLRKKPHPCEE